MRTLHAIVRSTAFATVLVLAGGPLARAQDKPQGAVSANQLLARMNDALEPARPSLEDVTIVMRTPSGEQAQWSAREARRRLAGGNRELTMVLTNPASVQGVAFVAARELAGETHTEWVYIPFVRRVREFTPTTVMEPFLGTDFTYGDLGLVETRRQDAKLLGEDTVGGQRAYEVESRLVHPEYTRAVTWISEATALPLRREFYDRGNKLWKVEEFSREETIDGTPTVLAVTMRDVQTGSSTEIRTNAITYDADVPQRLFEKQGLPTLANDPIWKAELKAVASR